MTVNTTKITAGPYNGNDLADTFSYGFTVTDKTELKVYETDDEGVQTLLTVDTDYTVNIGESAGGTITRLAGALPTSYQWYIRSSFDATQDTSFSSQGAFFPEIHEQAMDKLTLLIQQILDTQSRTPVISDTYSGPLNLTMPDPVVGEFMRWTSDLTGLENVVLDVDGLNQSIVNANTAADNANEAADEFEVVADEGRHAIAVAISSAGYSIIGDFSDLVKVEITEASQVYSSKSVANAEDALWRYTGTLPYTPTESAPTTDWVSVAQGELKAAALAAGTTYDNITYSNNLVDEIKGYIFDADTQITYAVPEAAQGKFIQSVVGGVLTTTDMSEYVMGRLTGGSDVIASEGFDCTGLYSVNLMGGDFSKVTKFTLALKTGNDAIAGKLSDINLTTRPYSAKVGGVEVWLMDINYYLLPTSSMSVKSMWVRADSESDDTIPLQMASEYQREQGVNLTLPVGTIITTKEIVFWSNNTSATETAMPRIYGAGQGLSKIKRITRGVSSLVDHESISSVIIVASDYARDGNVVTNPTSIFQTASVLGKMSGFSIEGDSPDSTKVGFGIYSLGLYSWVFEDLDISGVTTSMATQYHNVFCTYTRVKCELPMYAFDFGRTNFGGNSGMVFTECHCNGVNGVCYSIIGNAILTGCTIDGGAGIHYKIPGIDRGASGYLTGVITLIDCKSESPDINSANPMFDLNYGKVEIKNSAIEIPTLNYNASSVMIKANKYSVLTTENVRFSLRSGQSQSLGKLYQADATSRVTFDSESFIDTEWFSEYKKVTLNKENKFIIANRDNNDIDTLSVSKFISYVSGAVPAGERTVTTLSTSESRILIDCDQGGDHVMSNCIMFNKLVDVTNYTRIYVQGDLTFSEGSGTGAANYRVILNSSFIEDGSVGVGTAIPLDYTIATEGENQSNYSYNNFNRYIDISDIVGEFYIGVLLYGRNIQSNIKELSLLR